MGNPHRRAVVGTVAFALVACAAFPVHAQEEGTKLPLGKQIEKSIALGIDYLQKQQDKSGDWVEFPGYEGGTVALCTLALLNAGVSPKDPVITKAVESIRKKSREPRKVYPVSLQTMALCAARNRQDLEQIKQHAVWLQTEQTAAGAWGYGWNIKEQGDPSNSHFAILALDAAERFDSLIADAIKEETWRKALRYWVACQIETGAWGYVKGDSGSGSMTCAGIASVWIAESKLTMRLGTDNAGLLCCGKEPPKPHVHRGLEWMGKNYTVTANPGVGSFHGYYLCELERAGRLSGQRFLVMKGKQHDWYREGAISLIQSQDQLWGSWKGRGFVEGTHPNIATSMALLFLAHGRRPVLMSKLKYTDDGTWNQHPEDAANLTAHIETKWERDLDWQILDARTASLEDLTQSPILYMSGREAFQFTPEMVKRLKSYLEQGGFLFAECCCEGEEFDVSFRKLIAELYSEAKHDGGGELRKLAADHALWEADEPVPENRRVDLWGVSVGGRDRIVYSGKDVSCGWQRATPRRMKTLAASAQREVESALVIGQNVATYATGRKLKRKYELLDEKAGEPGK